jgi:hypothetical protein
LATWVRKRSQGEVARPYGVSQGWISRLVARYRDEGEAAFWQRSRRPKTSPRAVDPDTVELIIRLRKELAEVGQSGEMAPVGAGGPVGFTGRSRDNVLGERSVGRPGGRRHLGQDHR